ncbi:helix-turn-helix domain-containing protein [Persephonella sp.]
MPKVREETKFLLTHKIRAYPSSLLEYKMENWLYILHNLYNQAIVERKRAWKEEKKNITYTHQQNAFPKLKKEAKYPRKKNFPNTTPLPFHRYG